MLELASDCTDVEYMCILEKDRKDKYLALGIFYLRVVSAKEPGSILVFSIYLYDSNGSLAVGKAKLRYSLNNDFQELTLYHNSPLDDGFYTSDVINQVEIRTEITEEEGKIYQSLQNFIDSNFSYDSADDLMHLKTTADDLSKAEFPSESFCGYGDYYAEDIAQAISSKWNPYY